MIRFGPALLSRLRICGVFCGEGAKARGSCSTRDESAAGGCAVLKGVFLARSKLVGAYARSTFSSRVVPVGIRIISLQQVLHSFIHYFFCHVESAVSPQTGVGQAQAPPPRKHLPLPPNSLSSPSYSSQKPVRITSPSSCINFLDFLSNPSPHITADYRSDGDKPRPLLLHNSTILADTYSHR